MKTMQRNCSMCITVRKKDNIYSRKLTQPHREINGRNVLSLHSKPYESYEPRCQGDTPFWQQGHRGKQRSSAWCCSCRHQRGRSPCTHESWCSPVCSQPLSFTQIITGSEVSSVLYSNFWICYSFNLTYIRLPIFFSCTKPDVFDYSNSSICSCSNKTKNGSLFYPSFYYTLLYSQNNKLVVCNDCKCAHNGNLHNAFVLVLSFSFFSFFFPFSDLVERLHGWSVVPTSKIWDS